MKDLFSNESYILYQRQNLLRINTNFNLSFIVKTKIKLLVLYFEGITAENSRISSPAYKAMMPRAAGKV